MLGRTALPAPLTAPAPLVSTNHSHHLSTCHHLSTYPSPTPGAMHAMRSWPPNLLPPFFPTARASAAAWPTGKTIDWTSWRPLHTPTSASSQRSGGSLSLPSASRWPRWSPVDGAGAHCALHTPDLLPPRTPSRHLLRQMRITSTCDKGCRSKAVGIDGHAACLHHSSTLERGVGQEWITKGQRKLQGWPAAQGMGLLGMRAVTISDSSGGRRRGGVKGARPTSRAGLTH